MAHTSVTGPTPSWAQSTPLSPFSIKPLAPPCPPPTPLLPSMGLTCSSTHDPSTGVGGPMPLPPCCHKVFSGAFARACTDGVHISLVYGQPKDSATNQLRTTYLDTSINQRQTSIYLSIIWNTYPLLAKRLSKKCIRGIPPMRNSNASLRKECLPPQHVSIRHRFN